MDAYWVIPVGIIIVALVAIFFARIARHQVAPSKPHVLVDKPPEGPAIDPAAEGRDWSQRPCGSFLDWFRSR